jgi:hypothetical protein
MRCCYTRCFMRTRYGLVVAVLLGLSACSESPTGTSPPPQRESEQPEQLAPVLMVDMNNPAANRAIVQDIPSTVAASWRWTLKRPTVRVHPPANGNYIYHIDFAIAENTFQATGPVTLTFFVNDHVIGKERYTTPGVKSFDAPVPAGVLHPGTDNLLSAEIDKVYVAPRDKAHLGFILVRMGLKQ